MSGLLKELLATTSERKLRPFSLSSCLSPYVHFPCILCGGGVLPRVQSGLSLRPSVSYHMPPSQSPYSAGYTLVV